jgi:ABC-type nitrate/sulfonate/bicarbonate transport system permease component
MSIAVSGQALTVFRIGLLAVVCAAWELFARTAHSLLLPSCSQTALALADLVRQPATWRALWESNQAMLIGFALSLVIGLPLGFLAGRVREVEEAADPYLNFLLMVPVAALLPIFVMALGLGLIVRVAVVFMFTIPVVVVNVRAGLRKIDPALIDMAHSLGATERQLWLRVLLPGSLPGVLSGMRLGLGRALSGMVVAELLLIAAGVGQLMLAYQGRFESASLYALVIILVLEAVGLMGVAVAIERRATAWNRRA